MNKGSLVVHGMLIVVNYFVGWCASVSASEVQALGEQRG